MNTTDIAALREALLVSMEFVEAEAETGGKADLQMWLDVVYPAFTAKIVNELIELRDQLEAERQRARRETYARERDSENESIALTVGRLRLELAELRGKQEPFRYVVVKESVNIGYTQTLEDADFMSLQHGGVVIPLFTRQPNPVVVLSDCDIGAVSHMAHWYSEEQCEAWVAGVDHAKKQMQAAGIVVKDGE